MRKRPSFDGMCSLYGLDVKPQAADPNIDDADRDRAATHNAKVLEALRAGRRLGPDEARELCGTRRLGARIWDLRMAGWVIESERDPRTRCEVYWIRDENRDARKAVDDAGAMGETRA